VARQNGRVGEAPLPGGFVNAVYRVGDTVHRTAGPRSDYVRQVLGLLAEAGWAGAPRFLGLDAAGREVLSFVPGHVAWEPDQPAAAGSDESVARVAGLVREFHDLTAGTALAGDAEVVCHNDLSPKNTVYRDAGTGLRPAAFIDWDLAAPGQRIHDIAHVCWQYLGLGGGIEAGPAARGIRLVCDAYGLADRRRVVDVILWWQDRCWRGIAAAAAAGDPAMAGLRDAGAVREVQSASRWVAAHRRELAAGLA
jgi:hypothetical protein